MARFGRVGLLGLVLFVVCTAANPTNPAPDQRNQRDEDIVNDLGGGGYHAVSSSENRRFEIVYAISNGGNAPVLVHEGYLFIYTACGLPIRDVHTTSDTISFPFKLQPGESVRARLAGYTDRSVPYHFAIVLRFISQDGRALRQILRGAFEVTPNALPVEPCPDRT